MPLPTKLADENIPNVVKAIRFCFLLFCKKERESNCCEYEFRELKRMLIDKLIKKDLFIEVFLYKIHNKPNAVLFSK
jgi:hypothetical protein